MLFLEIERKPRRRCANSNNWRNGNTSVQQPSRRSILDLAKKKNVWIGWKNLTSNRTALVGILRLTRSTTAFATRRVSRRWSRRFFTKHSEDRQWNRREPRDIDGRVGITTWAECCGRAGTRANQFLRRAKATQRLQNSGRVRGHLLVAHSGGVDFLTALDAPPWVMRIFIIFTI